MARGGHYQANHATRQADVLLALGVRFDDRTSSSWIPGYSFTIPPTKLIHVDIDPEEIGRNYPVALGLMADVRTFLRQVLAELDRRTDTTRSAPTRARNGSRRSTATARNGTELVAPGFTDDSQPINPQRAAFEIDRGLPEDAILVSDIGVHHNWLLGYCKPRRPDSLIGSWGSARWVSASPACSAPSSPRPTGRACRCAATALSSCMRTCSAPRSNTICRSSGWCGTTTPMRRSAACSAAISAAASLRPTSTHPKTGARYNPDFAAMARSAGVEGVRVDRAADLAEAVRKGIAAHKPYLIDVDIAADINPAGAGVWELPGLGQSKPSIGTRYEPA